jgi:nucleotide-binding universal stress UspA family protein
MQAKRILVPIRLPSKSFDTLLFAQKIAAESPVSITLLNVVGLNIAFESTVYDEMCRESENALRRLGTRFLRDAVDVNIRVRVGNPRDEIVTEAKSSCADLILLSAPNRSIWKRWLSDGTIKGVVRKAPCPTMVLPEVWGQLPDTSQKTEPAVVADSYHCLTSAPV